jgi:protoporphyrinogen oxidase
MSKTLIIGAGYTGLAAGMELAKQNATFTIVEKQADVGGLSRSFFVGNTLFELGPHIYFDKDPDVTKFWKDLVGYKFKSHLRKNRIYFDGKYIKSPLSLIDATIKIGVFKIAYVLYTQIKAKLVKREIKSAEDWVVANFGKGLYEYFFKVYNEKIWGLNCNQVSANWAGQRIKSNLFTMVYKSFVRDHDFVVKTFDFPDGGSVTLCETQLQKLKSYQHCQLKLACSPQIIESDNNGFKVKFSNGKVDRFTHVIATCHLQDLANVLKHPEVNYDILNGDIQKLMYRQLVLVNLVFNKVQVRDFKEHWIDVHDPAIKTLRVTNFANYELDNANTSVTGIGLEYNCFETDDIWQLDDQAIVQIAMQDLLKMQLVSGKPQNFSVLKFDKAYPIYFNGYEQSIKAIQDEFAKVKGLELAGRNALYRWNNMHHSVKTGILSARNCLGEKNNLNEVKGMVAFGKDSD